MSANMVVESLAESLAWVSLSALADLPWLPICRHRRHRAHRRSTFRRCRRSTTGPIGVNGGWGWGNAKYTANAFAGFPGTTGSLSDNGGVVGGTLGANFQSGAFVFGVEGDWDYSAINTGTTSSICTFSGNCQTGNNWLATARGRAGYAADRVLLYAAAGSAFANVQTNFNGTTTSHTQSGWTAGAGIEWPSRIIGRPRSNISTSISAMGQ